MWSISRQYQNGLFYSNWQNEPSKNGWNFEGCFNTCLKHFICNIFKRSKEEFNTEKTVGRDIQNTLYIISSKTLTKNPTQRNTKSFEKPNKKKEKSIEGAFGSSLYSLYVNYMYYMMYIYIYIYIYMYIYIYIYIYIYRIIK